MATVIISLGMLGKFLLVVSTCNAVLSFLISPSKCTACTFLMTCLKPERGSQNTSYIFLLALSSSPGRFPHLPVEPVLLAQCKAQKTKAEPRMTEIWFWVPFYEIEYTRSDVFRQKRGLNPACNTVGEGDWLRAEKFPQFWVVVKRVQKLFIISAVPDQGGWGKPILQILMVFSCGLDTDKL